MTLRARLTGWLRRVLQLGVLAFVVYAAMGGPWRNYKVAHNHRRLVGLMHGETWGWLYGLNEDLLSVFGKPYDMSLGFVGMPWAANAFGLHTADPILVTSSVLNSGHLSGALLSSLLLPLGLALVLGKVFCSHLCPMRLSFEVGEAMRRGLQRLGLELPRWQPRIQLGGWVLLGGLVAAWLSSMAIWLFLLPYVGVAATLVLALSGGAVLGLALPALLWLLVDILVAPGLFCHSVCPTGWLLQWPARLSLLKLRKSGTEPCPTSCDLCEQACPYGLQPSVGLHIPACDNCGRCAAVCPSDRLARTLSIGAPILPQGAGVPGPEGPGSRLGSKPGPNPSDLRSKPGPVTTATTLLLAGLLAAAICWPATARAHHNKGLPHYGYFENYPQVPTEEYVALQGKWEIGATIFNFQGLDRSQADTPNDVKIYLYLYDLKADKAWQGVLKVDVRKDGLTVATFDRLMVDEEAVYSTRETLPESGEYELVAHVDGQEVVLPFYVDLAGDGVNWWLVAAFAVPVFLVFALALFGRRRRRGGRGRSRKTAVNVSLLLPFLLPLLLLAMGPLVSAPAHAAPGVKKTAPMAAKAAAGAVCVHCGMIDCPMDHSQPVDSSAGDVCPKCGMTGCNMDHYKTDDGGEVMIMAGIPRWLFLLAVVGLIVLSFVATEWLAPKASVGFRFNILGSKRAYAIARSRWLQPVAQLSSVAVFAFLIWTGLAGSRVANITPVAVWTLWWGGLIFAVLLLGAAFCFACPWDGLANLGSRLRLAARVDTLSLGLPFPGWLANLYPAIGLFVLLTWLELGYGVTTDPRWTAYMGLGMAAMAVTAALLWDGKRFCAHGCPVGRICGIYGNFSPVELRARKPRACEVCTTEDCLNGNDKGYPCPTGISLKTIEDATHCTFCTECIKSCNKNNVAINLRPFGADLSSGRKIRTDEAWLALMLLGLTLFHGLSMTPAWENFAPGSASLLKWMNLHTGLPKTVNFSIAMVGAMAIPVGLYWGCCWLGARWSAGQATTVLLFRQFSWSLLPVALFYHLAHNLMHVLMEGGHIVPMLSDPLGRGDDWLGTAGLHVGSLIAEDTLWYAQVALILIGHIFGIVVSHRVGHRLFADRKLATRVLIPMLLMMILISIGGLSLMHLDMNMRVGRM